MFALWAGWMPAWSNESRENGSHQCPTGGGGGHLLYQQHFSGPFFPAGWVQFVWPSWNPFNSVPLVPVLDSLLQDCLPPHEYQAGMHTHTYKHTRNTIWVSLCIVALDQSLSPATNTPLSERACVYTVSVAFGCMYLMWVCNLDHSGSAMFLYNF